MTDLSKPQPRTVSWTSMQDGDQADYELLTPLFEEHARAALVDNLTTMLDMLKGPNTRLSDRSLRPLLAIGYTSVPQW